MDEDRGMGEPELRKRRYIKIRASLILLLFIVLLGGLPLAFISQRTAHFFAKIVLTKANLKSLRGEIREFKAITGSYANSLAEIRRYAKENPASEITQVKYRECISDKGNNAEEFDVLNGQGGWYYDKTTGKVKINLTKPVRYYFKFYFGSSRNEIPCEW